MEGSNPSPDGLARIHPVWLSGIESFRTRSSGVGDAQREGATYHDPVDITRNVATAQLDATNGPGFNTGEVRSVSYTVEREANILTGGNTTNDTNPNAARDPGQEAAPDARHLTNTRKIGNGQPLHTNARQTRYRTPEWEIYLRRSSNIGPCVSSSLNVPNVHRLLRSSRLGGGRSFHLQSAELTFFPRSLTSPSKAMTV